MCRYKVCVFIPALFMESCLWFQFLQDYGCPGKTSSSWKIRYVIPSSPDSPFFPCRPARVKGHTWGRRENLGMRLVCKHSSQAPTIVSQSTCRKFLLASVCACNLFSAHMCISVLIPSTHYLSSFCVAYMIVRCTHVHLQTHHLKHILCFVTSGALQICEGVSRILLLLEEE